MLEDFSQLTLPSIQSTLLTTKNNSQFLHLTMWIWLLQLLTSKLRKTLHFTNKSYVPIYADTWPSDIFKKYS